MECATYTANHVEDERVQPLQRSRPGGKFLEESAEIA